MSEKGLDIKIIVATHKTYSIPVGDIYIPVQVGAEGKHSLGFQRDDEGDNISIMNPCFCELTGQYWAWKNLKCDYLGLAHYRRHFSIKKKKDIWDSTLTDEQAQLLCTKYDVILPKKRYYIIETLESHYGHTHYIEHLQITRKVVEEKYPEYIEVYDRTLRQRSGYMFNMFIMKSDLADEYCSFLFDILFDVEKMIDYSDLSAFQARLFGRISEILLNVWINYKCKEQNLRTIDIPCIHMEKVDWGKKGVAFLKAKFLGQRYEANF